MAIKFNVIQRGEPGVVGGGTKKYYASTQMAGELDIDKLTKAIEKISTVSGADIRAVLYALVDVSIDALADSQIVRLGDLGSIRISVGSEGKNTEEEINAGVIKSTKVLFTPGKRIKDMQQVLTFVKV